jgi:hypothetical protein
MKPDISLGQTFSEMDKARDDLFESIATIWKDFNLNHIKNPKMEEKFNKIREIVNLFGEDAFYSIDITKYGIRFQGDVTRDSVRIAEDAGFKKEKGGTYLAYNKDNNRLTFV